MVMGTGFFKSKPPKAYQSSGQNLQARAGGAGGYSGRAAGAGAQKDIAGAIAMFKAHPLKPTAKTAATVAPGPKKV